MNNENSFEYTYSAKEQEELRKIREKYLPREENKLEQLRRLDAGVTKKGTAMALTLGILSCLVFGTGMSCCLVWAGVWFVPGILIGCIGLAGVTATYPIYNHIVKQDREKAAPEILRLSEELILGNN